MTSPDSDSHAPPITYSRTTWVDGSVGGTQVTAARLNNAETGVTQSYTVLNDHDDRLDALEAAPGLQPGINQNSKGPTSSRPAPTLDLYYYDTTLLKPLWGDGSGWRDYTGSLVGGAGGSNAPQNFTAVTQQDNTIRCNWSPVTGASTYKVYESQYTSGVPGGSGISGTSFTFTPPAQATAAQVVQEKAFEITSTAENSTVDWTAQYTYIEDIGDQRGYTGGIVGFTSATGDMLDIVKNFATVKPGNILAKYINGLTTCASVGMGSSASSAASSNLGTAFIADWHTASTDPVWQKVQRDYRESVYWAPAYNAAVADGLSPLGIALYYDTSVNHGPGKVNSNDGSFDDIRSRTTGTKPVNGGSETTWLNNFLNVRSAVLTAWGDNPSNGRITMFRTFVSGGKFALATPLSWSIYGDSFTMATDPTPGGSTSSGTTGFTANLFVATTGNDSNAGTSKAAPKATIGAAITAAAAGQTISVAPGAYTGNVVPSKGGNSTGGYITVRSETKWGAVISGSSAGQQSAIDIAHDYLRFQDFEITGTDNSGVRYGVMIETNGNVEIKGCHIHNICQFLTEGTGFQGGAGIDFEGTTHSNISVDGNWIHKIGLPTSTQQLVHGLYLSGNCTNTVISNNLIHQCEDFGIQVFPTDSSSGITHINNTVFGNGRGIQQANSGITRNNISYNNRSSNYDIRGTGNTLSNNFSGGTGDVSLSGVTSGVNPQFVNYAIDGNGDLHLQSGSPCIDQGAPTGAPDHDLDGVTRPQGAAVDAGCYEYTTTPANPANRTYDLWATATVAAVEGAASNHAQATIPYGSNPGAGGLPVVSAGADATVAHSSTFSRTGTVTGSGITATGWRLVVTSADDNTAAKALSWGQPLAQSDEFEYTGPPDPAKWGVYDGPGHAGNGIRNPARCTVANGKLTIQGMTGSADTGGMASALNQQYGKWEVRTRNYYTNNPNLAGTDANGYHPVCIVWPSDDVWPQHGEYDFIETDVPGMQATDGFLHYPSINGTDSQIELPAVACDMRQFHNFAIEWTSSFIKTYIDGVLWSTASGGGNSSRHNIQDMPLGQLTLQLDAFHSSGFTASTMEFEWARIYPLVPVNPNTGLSSTAALSWTAPTQPGTYTLELFATNSAGTATDQITVTVT